MAREHWRSRLGFIWAAVGSAIGLGSIWRFPYVVGENGGATFILLYLICLAIVGFPVLMAEIAIGRKTQLSPSGAFEKLGKTTTWKQLGKITVVTGFLVSTFYGVVCGLTLGYLISSVLGKLGGFTSASEASHYFKMVSSSGTFMVGCQAAFMLISGWILYTGVQKGIERGNKIMMPLLLVVLLVLVAKGLSMPGSEKGLKFMFQPDWSLLTPKAVIVALGQAFFSLSLGQGTMVTYGSYIKEHENLPTTCVPITLFGIIVAMLAGMSIFAIVFSMGLEPSSGMSLMFETLPLVFSQIPGGYLLSLAFFTLLFLAALTSQISAMEPPIAYLMDRFQWKRHKAVAVIATASFIVGVPSALSLSVFGIVEYASVNVLVPLGGLAAVVLVGWRWGMNRALQHLKIGTGDLFDRYPIFSWYLRIGMKYIAPFIIVIVMLDALGLFR